MIPWGRNLGKGTDENRSNNFDNSLSIKYLAEGLIPHICPEHYFSLKSGPSDRINEFEPSRPWVMRILFSPNHTRPVFGDFDKKCIENTRKNAFGGLVWLDMVW